MLAIIMGFNVSIGFTREKYITTKYFIFFHLVFQTTAHQGWEYTYFTDKWGL